MRGGGKTMGLAAHRAVAALRGEWSRPRLCWVEGDEPRETLLRAPCKNFLEALPQNTFARLCRVDLVLWLVLWLQHTKLAHAVLCALAHNKASGSFLSAPLSLTYGQLRQPTAPPRTSTESMQAEQPRLPTRPTRRRSRAGLSLSNHKRSQQETSSLTGQQTRALSLPQSVKLGFL